MIRKCQKPLSAIQVTRGFTLIEMLFVISVIALLGALSMPAFNSIKRSTDLQSGASRIMDQLALARQSARTLNHAVEVRFYAGTNADCTALRLYVQPEGSAAMVPMERKLTLPQTVVIAGNSTYTTLFSSGSVSKDEDGNDYKSFRFNPDGTVDLPAGSTAITLMLAVESSAGALPANYATIVVDPVTGRLRYFRPF